jgi:hypothetical protein
MELHRVLVLTAVGLSGIAIFGPNPSGGAS